MQHVTNHVSSRGTEHLRVLLSNCGLSAFRLPPRSLQEASTRSQKAPRSRPERSPGGAQRLPRGSLEVLWELLEVPKPPQATILDTFIGFRASKNPPGSHQVTIYRPCRVIMSSRNVPKRLQDDSKSPRLPDDFTSEHPFYTLIRTYMPTPVRILIRPCFLSLSDDCTSERPFFHTRT